MSSTSAEGGRKLFDLINVPLLLFVAVCFFLPLFKLECATGARISFNGINMTVPTAPSAEGVPQKDVDREFERLVARQQTEASSRQPLAAAWDTVRNHELFLLLVPLFAIQGAYLSWKAFSGNPAKRALITSAAIAAIVLTGYTVFGFAMENQLVADLSRQGGGRDGWRCEKTAWFFLALAAAWASTLLVALRDSSPRLREGIAILEQPATQAVGAGDKL